MLFFKAPGSRRGPSFLDLPVTWLLPCAILAIPAVVAEKTAADYYVRSLPGQPAGPLLKMHAGHVEVDPANNGNLFFWHYQNRHIANRQRTVIWLNGGPGCSSMDGALTEVGPYRLKDNHTLQYNEGSWDEFANLLFVDQPVGTGFSYVNTNSYLKELDEMASQFVTFLEKWFKLFPEYEQDDLYFAGESYAGTHIPYIAKAILDRNNNINSTEQSTKWNLKGLLIGNGWLSPVEQYPAYLTYAYKEGLVKRGSEAAKRLESQQATCLSDLSDGGKDTVHTNSCEKILSKMLDETRKNNGKDDDCINIYDIRLRDSFSSCGMNWPPDMKHITPYLRQSEVVKALNVDPDKRTGWEECSGTVSLYFRTQHSRPSIHLLPGLLEAGIPITLFSGQKDLICNHIGTEETIHNMKWGGGTGFEISPGVWAPRRDWKFEGEAAGIYQEARNLTYVLFYNASHMVPFDYTRRSREMLDRFLGVDITSIGGNPADSRLDGTKNNPTSVGGHPNSTAAEQREKEKLKEATWEAYYKSGEVALVIVIIIAGAWGFFIWRARRQRQGSGYQGIYPNHDGLSSGSLPRFRSKRSTTSDVEAAAEFDEAELDNLSSQRDYPAAPLDEPESEHYAVGEDSDDDDEKNSQRGRGPRKPAGPPQA